MITALVRALDHPAASGRTYNVTDMRDVSTPELIAAIAVGASRRPRLLPCPVPLLRIAAGLAGRGNELSRLVDSMAVDATRLWNELDWIPPFDLAEGLARTLAKPR